MDASEVAHSVQGHEEMERGQEKMERGHEEGRAPGARATSDAAGDATSAAAPAADTSGGASAALMDSLCSLVDASDVARMRGPASQILLATS